MMLDRLGPWTELRREAWPSLAQLEAEYRQMVREIAEARRDQTDNELLRTRGGGEVRS